MVNARPLLLLSLCVAACGGSDAEPPVLELARDRVSCASAQECVTAGVESRELHGLRIIHKRMVGSPIVAVRVMIDGGVAHWTPETAHAVTLVAQTINWWGSQLHVPNWAHLLADLGAEVTAGEGTSYSYVSLLAPKFRLAESFRLLGDAVNRPPIELAPNGIELLKQSYVERYKTEADDPQPAAALAAWSLLAHGHPYNLRREHQDAIQDLSASDLWAARFLLSEKSPMTITIVGDLSLDDAVDLATRAFASESRPLTRGDESLPAFVPSTRRLELSTRSDAPAWYVDAKFAAPNPSDADYAALQLGVAVLSSRLFNELRTERGLVYAVTAQVFDYRTNWGSLTLSTDMLPEAMDALRETLARVLDEGIEDAELEGERAQLLTSSYVQSHGAAPLSWRLGDRQMTTGDWREASAHIDRVMEVDATAAREALATYLSNLRWGIAGPDGGFTENQLLGEPAVDK